MAYHLAAPRRGRMLKNRQGATLPIVAVCIVMLMGCAAFAIDIGMLLDSRAEAQRAADSAALAGASGLFDFRNQSQEAQRAAGTARAISYATQNRMLGGPIEADEVDIEFLDNDRRISVTITRGSIAPIFAGIFGVSSLQVAANAHAMYYQGGGATCLKPFGVPETAPFTTASVGERILIWEKDEHNLYPLVKHLLKDEGGNNVRDAIEGQGCNPALINVGDLLELQSGTAGFTGQVEQGLNTLFNRDKTLVYDPGNPDYADNNGFNRPDWRQSSRIIDLVTYNPLTATQTTFVATGFISIFLSEEMEKVQGNRFQYGIVLPHRAPAGGPCTPPNCSALSWGLRLVQ